MFAVGLVEKFRAEGLLCLLQAWWWRNLRLLVLEKFKAEGLLCFLQALWWKSLGLKGCCVCCRPGDGEVSG